MAAVADLKQEWHQFRHDRPGERFYKHRERMRKKSRKHTAAAFALGVLLCAAGFMFLFIPGPGLPLIVFGLALVATHWKRLADGMDRAELRLRRATRRVGNWWRHSSRVAKAAVVTGGLVVASGFLLAMWRWVVSAYLL
jgi:hypothetical protein